MSPEIETLDQLLGGELSLAVVRGLFPDDESFRSGLLGLLTSGDVTVVEPDGSELPTWRWKRLFGKSGLAVDKEPFRLIITAQGAQRVS